ncbi:MAG: efflux RND transporter periplasmic adaptor subunit, partial [Marivirga sp.]|nr:efflux RND transporter periplasmic adaptor subunit [Marivirga sp.]
MKKNIIILLLAMAGFFAYGQHDHSGHSHSESASHKKKRSETVSIPPAFQKQLSDVFIASIQLKEALVQSDSSKASVAASDVKTSISKTDLTLLKDELMMDWMTYLKTFNESLDKISASANLDDQREAFALYSNALYKSVKKFGIGMPAYYDYCPMANNNEGAYWVSNEKEIRNPYFGEKMLTC